MIWQIAGGVILGLFGFLAIIVVAFMSVRIVILTGWVRERRRALFWVVAILVVFFAVLASQRNP